MRNIKLIFPVFCIILLQAVILPQSNALETRENVEKVIVNFTRLIQSNPKKAFNYVQRGDEYFKILEFDLAIDDYTTALSFDDSEDLAYYGRGLALGRRGLVDEGITDLSVFLKRNPNSSLGFTKRGVRYLWKRDLVNAQTDLTRAIELDKNNAEAHDDLGVVLSLLEDYEGANQHYLECIKIDPSYQKAYHNLAMSYYILGKDKSALDVINDALELRPEARASKMLKAKILQVLGQEKQAAELMDEAEFLPEGNWSENISVVASTVDSELTLEGLDKTQHYFRDIIGKGKWTILNIWGPKCPPCLEEMQQLQAFHDDHNEKDATVIGLAIDYPSFRYAKRDEVIKFMDLNSISYQMYLGDAKLVPKFGGGELTAIPMTLAFSPQGELKMSYVGLITADLLEKFITDNYQ